jgi:hypothetical protein
VRRQTHLFSPSVRRLAALFAVGFVVAATPAGAVGNYLDEIPARPDACFTCHTDTDDGALNRFGEETLATLFLNGTTPSVDWSLIYNIDSDGDGQTNGQELGDPCGEWTPGEGGAGRLFAISHPGVDTDLSASPTLGCTSDDMPWLEPAPRVYDPGVGGPAYDEGQNRNFGCFGGGGGLSQTAPPADGMFFGLVLLLLSVRRSRR